MPHLIEYMGIKRAHLIEKEDINIHLIEYMGIKRAIHLIEGDEY
jgi:hypothetical protein